MAARPELKLYYFDIGGKAEAIRLALHYAELEFEDVRMNRDAFAAKKASGELPFGQLPCLSWNGTLVAQSNAILRLIGRSGASSKDIYPTDPLAAPLVDGVLDQLNDATMGHLVKKYGPRYGFELDDAKKEEIEGHLKRDIIPRHFSFLETLATNSPTGWIAGTEGPSVADFAMIYLLHRFPHDEWLQLDLNAYPKLRTLLDNLLALPSVAAYHAKHPSG